MKKREILHYAMLHLAPPNSKLNRMTGLCHSEPIGEESRLLFKGILHCFTPQNDRGACENDMRADTIRPYGMIGDKTIVGADTICPFFD